MEHVGAKHHRERMAESIREELTALVEGELGDPRIGLVSVNEVLISPDGKSARVSVSAEGSEKDAARTMEGLTAARAFIRAEITQRLHLRQAPELSFYLDHSVEYTARIDELLQRINKRNR
jgi:ribosome-binding factor A